MFHNISNPKWFGNWSRLEDDYLGNGGTDIADNFTFSKMEKTGGLFGSIIRLATAFPACDPETGHATGAWKVACESIDLDEVPLADVDEDGFPLIAALRPGGNAVSEGRSVGGTIVCSFYGKPENYFRFKMQQMPQRVLYQDIEKGRELDARAKLQLFGGNIASPDLDRRIIRPPECIVKLRADTPQMETHGRETSRVRRESRDMASGRAALDAGRRAETARVTERHIDSNLK